MQISTYALVVATGSNSHPQFDSGNVGVIDGRESQTRLLYTLTDLGTLKLTPLRSANIPPPMCLHELQLANEAQDISINSILGALVVLTNENVEIFSQNPRRTKATPVLQHSISLSGIEGVPLQVTVTDDGRVFLLEHGCDNISRLLVTRVAEESTEDLSWDAYDTHHVALSSIFRGLNQDLAFSEAPNGEVYDFSSTPNRFLSVGKLPELCPWVEVVRIGSRVCNQVCG